MVIPRRENHAESGKPKHKIAVLGCRMGEKSGSSIKGTVPILPSSGIFRQDVAWMKEVRPNLRPKVAFVLTNTDVFGARPGVSAGKKIL